MFKIWAKTFNGEKIRQSIIYENTDKFLSEKFFDYLVEICQKLDIPTPVILNSHKQHFLKFNSTRFNRGDFVESISFTSLVLENVPEK